MGIYQWGSACWYKHDKDMQESALCLLSWCWQPNYISERGTKPPGLVSSSFAPDAAIYSSECALEVVRDTFPIRIQPVSTTTSSSMQFATRQLMLSYQALYLNAPYV